MPTPELDPDQRLRNYVRERNAVADEALRQQPLLVQSVLAKVRKAQAQPSPANADVEKLLGDYVQRRDAVAAQAVPLHRAEINALVTEAAPRRKANASPTSPWWKPLRRHWLVAGPIAGAAAILLLIFVLRHGDQRRAAPMRVVFAASALRGGAQGNGTSAALSLPLTLEIDLTNLTVKLVQSNGTVYSGSLADGQVLQTNPWKRRFAVTANGKNPAGEVVELRGMLTLTIGADAVARPATGQPAKVLGVILELDLTVAGNTLPHVRLEFPE